MFTILFKNVLGNNRIINFNINKHSDFLNNLNNDYISLKNCMYIMKPGK